MCPKCGSGRTEISWSRKQTCLHERCADCFRILRGVPVTERNVSKARNFIHSTKRKARLAAERLKKLSPIKAWRKNRSLQLPRKPPEKTKGFAAIPTMYGNIQFRSRLEARWAAFFDLLSWIWEYEPRDMPGWIPDFVIVGGQGEVPALHSEILVEVKPVLVFPEPVARKIESALSGQPDDGIPREPLIVGERPLWMDDQVSLGWLGDECGPGHYAWGSAVMGVWDGELPPGPYGKHVIGFCHEDMSFVDRISGRYDGSTHQTDVAVDEIRDYWAEAGNRVQYKSPRRENCA